eukprot:NODE_277_length_1737_cov_543.129814_g248_i0.p1 GENE.NODE_277_length_1737_cov_543.129814_g248_i0~~NODE_277_length_1737_cov_543.129814_g248_i0.p1  ORF type:complete len:523 (+),score=155.85 NODE_277_length_1737_cov_543.129814_g248_i0:76-1644(+)
MARDDLNQIEEIAYRNRPPLLEDASIRGPTRTPIRDAMLTLEERDAIEADFRWYRYSKCALPWLLFCLFMGIGLFCLTAWQQVGGIKELNANPVNTRGRQGIPFTLVTIAESDSDIETGIPKHLRNVRIAEVFFAFFGIIFCFWTLFSKPRPKPRTACNYIWVILLLVAFVLAAIAFGWGIDRLDDVKHCEWNWQNTFSKCFNRKWKGVVAVTLDAAVAVGCLFSAILLALYTASGDWRLQRMGWRERERDAETEIAKQKDPVHLAMHNIRNVRITLLSIVLCLTLAVTIIAAVWIVIIHEDRNREFYTQTWGSSVRGKNMNLQSGWPDRNTRLRYAASAITVLTILINLIPFTHRLIAYAFAFFYFVASVLCFVTFGFDVHEMQEADDYFSCPQGLRCVKSPFIGTAIVEFLLGLALFFYVFYEFCLKCCPFAASKHSKRHYAVHELKKHDQKMDSLRPVRCEITGRVMTAKEYVYRWRFIAGTQQAAEYVPMYPEQPLYAAEDYAPEPMVAAAAAAPYGM